MATKYGVTMVPTLLLFKNGSITETVVGLRLEDELRQLMTAAQSG
jgi:thioredoxin-like negative regulator of GroEL